MTLQFTKMHGLGNDFIVLDATQNPILLSPDRIATLSCRNTGIGFDQCLIVEKSKTEDTDFFYRIFNSDGQEVGQCGNGARCLARFIQKQGLSYKHQLRVQTSTTILDLTLHDDKTVTVTFPPPLLTPKQIPLLHSTQETWYRIVHETQSYQFHAINVGNPHVVFVVDNLALTDIHDIGKTLSTHPFFPEQTNVGFMQILNMDHILLRVYERGCGETQACGSGAVAAAALGMLYHQLNDHLRVSLPGGDLFITWPNKMGPLFLRGPATFVYEANLLEDDRCAS